MFSGLSAYLSLGLGGLLVASVSLNVWNGKSIDHLETQLHTEKVELASCGARLSNLVEDLKSDNQIDALPDSALVNVPDHWLLDTEAD